MSKRMMIRLNTVTVFQWNMLEDSSAQSFVNVDAKFRQWTHRKPQIISILTGHDPDIICIQECDKFEELQEALKAKYNGTFVKKIGDDHKDGVAIFIKCHINLRTTTSIQLKTDGRNDAQVALINELQIGDEFIYVVSTHLKSNEFESQTSETKTNKPDFDAIRKAQATCITDALINKWFNRHGHRSNDATVYAMMPYFSNVRVLLLGDLNEDRNGSAVTYLNLLGLKSAYESVYPKDDCYTTFKKRKEKVKCQEEDYILHSSHFKVCELLSLPPKEAFLPNEHYPSDHVYLCARFCF